MVKTRNDASLAPGPPGSAMTTTYGCSGLSGRPPASGMVTVCSPGDVAGRPAESSWLGKIAAVPTGMSPGPAVGEAERSTASEIGPAVAVPSTWYVTVTLLESSVVAEAITTCSGADESNARASSASQARADGPRRRPDFPSNPRNRHPPRTIRRDPRQSIDAIEWETTAKPGGRGDAYPPLLPTGFLSTPSPSISTSTTSPSFNQTGGFRAMPTPGGVPVKIRSPGSRVKIWEM